MATSVDPSAGNRAVLRQFRLAFLVLFLLGLVGVIATIPSLRGLTASFSSSGTSSSSMLIIAGLQLTLLLGVWVAIGIFVAPRLRLRSHLVAWIWKVPFGEGSLRHDLLTAVPVGIAIAVVLLLLGPVIDSMLGASAAPSHAAPRTVMGAIEGVLYGGLTEELIMRWGVLSLLAWLAWRFIQRDGAPIRSGTMWPAIVLSAIFFGAGHVGAVAATASFTQAVIVRTILLNTAAGIVLGWLFWRRSLESAMLAHATFQVAVSVAAWLGLTHAML